MLNKEARELTEGTKFTVTPSDGSPSWETTFVRSVENGRMVQVRVEKYAGDWFIYSKHVRVSNG